MSTAQFAINADRALAVRHARLVLAIFLLATVFFVGVTLSPLRSGFADSPDRGPGDVALYRSEIARMRQGESYYNAAAAELRSRGYPTHSLFNWRTPLPVWLLARVPGIEWGNALLGAVALMLLLSSFSLLADDSGLKSALLSSVLLTGALLPCILGELVVMSELWAGVLVALSAVLFGLGRRNAGMASGLAALFLRELAAPYILVCLVLSAHERRWRELGLWFAGLAAYGLFFTCHVSQVVPRILPDDRAHAGSWLCFGGAGFLISTAQMNAFLLLLPQWITAIYLAMALVGCATWNTPAGRLVVWTTLMYCVAFSIAGHDFNQYWGSMIAPLMCLPAGRAPAVLMRLWQAARPAALVLRAGHPAV